MGARQDGSLRARPRQWGAEGPSLDAQEAGGGASRPTRGLGLHARGPIVPGDRVPAGSPWPGPRWRAGNPASCGTNTPGSLHGHVRDPPTPNHSAELPPVFQALVASCGSSVTPVRACRAAEPAQVKLPQGRSLTLNVCKGAEGAARAVPGLAHVVAFRRFVDLGEK